jgi:hypothetical protein
MQFRNAALGSGEAAAEDWTIDVGLVQWYPYDLGTGKILEDVTAMIDLIVARLRLSVIV